MLEPLASADPDWLTLDLAPYLHYPLQLQIQGWHGPSPFAWRSFSDKGVLAEGGFLQTPGLPLPNTLVRDVPPQVLWLGRIAPQWNFALLQSCARLPAALELAHDAPLLLILIVEHAQRCGWNQAQLSDCLALKRSEILANIGLPGSASLARLLRRMTLIPITALLLSIARQRLQQPNTLELLRHHARPSLNHLWLLYHFQQSVPWPGLLAMVDDSTSMLGMLWLRRMSEDIQRLAGNDISLHRTNTRQQLQTLHDRLVVNFNAAHHSRRSAELGRQHGGFPEPPLPGNARIQPLVSWEELLIEGERMRHCIGSYGSRIASRQCFVYHMQAPETLTIALIKRGEKWGLEEARGYGNALPSDSSLELIHQWLSASTVV